MGEIVGGIVGGILGLIAIGACFYVFLRRRGSLSGRNGVDPQYGGEKRDGYTGRSRFKRSPTIEPFPFSTTVSSTRSSQVLQGKDLLYNSTGSYAQISFDRKNVYQADISSSQSLPLSQTQTRNEPKLSIRSLTGTRRGESTDQEGNEPSSSDLEAIMLNRERALRNEMETLRREVQMIRHGEGVETASVVAPPTYRDDL